jgi:hypothetical protein
MIGHHLAAGQHVVRGGCAVLLFVYFASAFILFVPLAVLTDETLAGQGLGVHVLFEKTTGGQVIAILHHNSFGYMDFYGLCLLLPGDPIAIFIPLKSCENEGNGGRAGAGQGSE